jgi:hypothetical protein
MSRRNTIVIVAVLTALPGCCGAGAAGVARLDDGKTAQKYFEQLVPWTGASSVTACTMFSGSRKGRCQITGSSQNLRQLSTKLEYVAEPGFGPAFGTQTCLLEPSFGVPDHNGHAPAPGTVVFTPPTAERWRAGPWPLNQKNVVPGRLFVREADGKACFEFSYPYG